MKKILYSLFFYALTGLGISLTIKANIGVSSFNSLNLSLSVISGIKVGTVSSLVNGAFIILYMILTGLKQRNEYISQGVSVYALGLVINFFVYTVFANVHLNSYLSQIICFMVGICISGFGTGMVLNLRVLAFPIESVCRILSEKTKVSFMKLRYSVDVLSISTSLIITFLTNSDLFIREGTVLSLFLLSFMIGITKKTYEKNPFQKD
ncbi:MAG: hypothetical protein RR565_03245 [Erysipelothrix sp.]